jgi:predicted phosphodiesterase
MKAVISDVHGNLAALNAVLADIDSKGIKEIVCLGDIVGYGPEPRECLELLKGADTLIMGNHEHAVLNPETAKQFNVRARQAIDWTRKQLLHDPNESETVQNARAQLISDFKIKANIEGIQYVHGSPRNPIREYISPRDIGNKTKMIDIFKHTEAIYFIGHSHIPGVFAANGYTHPSEMMDIYILGEEKVLINVGSVGQPRDGDPRASYVTFDTDTVIFRRVEYDVETTIRKVYATGGLDNFFGDRLSKGR